MKIIGSRRALTGGRGALGDCGTTRSGKHIFFFRERRFVSTCRKRLVARRASLGGLRERSPLFGGTA